MTVGDLEKTGLDSEERERLHTSEVGDKDSHGRPGLGLRSVPPVLGSLKGLEPQDADMTVDESDRVAMANNEGVREDREEQNDLDNVRGRGEEQLMVAENDRAAKRRRRGRDNQRGNLRGQRSARQIRSVQQSVRGQDTGRRTKRSSLDYMT